MGQKINPNGFRLSVSRNWTSRWYANNTDFANMLKEDVEVRNYLKKKLKNASVSKVLIERPAKNALKCLILTMPLCQHLLLSMSSTPTSYELSNADCEKGHATQRPPIPYAVSKNGLLISTLQETIEVKVPKGESKQTLLGNGADREEYVKHLMSFFQFMEKKGYKADLEVASKVTLSATKALKKLVKAQTREKDPAKAKRLTKVKAAKVRLINTKVAESTLAGLAYDLFRKLLRDESKIQWDQIVTDMHTKNPWEDIKGVNSLSAMDGRDRPLKN